MTLCLSMLLSIACFFRYTSPICTFSRLQSLLIMLYGMLPGITIRMKRQGKHFRRHRYAQVIWACYIIKGCLIGKRPSYELLKTMTVIERTWKRSRERHTVERKREREREGARERQSKADTKRKRKRKMERDKERQKKRQIFIFGGCLPELFPHHLCLAIFQIPVKEDQNKETAWYRQGQGQPRSAPTGPWPACPYSTGKFSFCLWLRVLFS